jgi:hypothetical protein
MDLSWWRTASAKRKRIYTVIFFLILAILVTVAGTFVPLGTEEAELIASQVNSTITENRDIASLTGVIFVNNFSISLLMFIPIVGPILGFAILFVTGTALSAISLVQGFPIWLSFLALVITPIFWLEFIAYSFGMAQSTWLFRRLMQRRWRELKWTAISIGIVAAMLAIGAVVEAWLIIAAGV